MEIGKWKRLRGIQPLPQSTRRVLCVGFFVKVLVVVGRHSVSAEHHQQANGCKRYFLYDLLETMVHLLPVVNRLSVLRGLELDVKQHAEERNHTTCQDCVNDCSA